MKFMALGKNWSGELLYPSFDPATFADRLTNVLQTPRSLQFGTCGPKAVAASVNDLDPLQAGWTFVVSANDPRRNEYIEALQPLAIHRGMTNPATPLLFKAGVDNVREWHTWLQHSYLSADLQGRKLPRYMLFVGGPEMLPFRFQAMMDSVAHVGRLSFDRSEDLRAYVDKVVRIEKAPEPVVEREMLMFATDGGRNDPTHYSCRFMARPLADYVEQTHGVAITRLFGKDATKQALEDRLHNSRPAIVYAASHGLGLTADESADGSTEPLWYSLDIGGFAFFFADTRTERHLRNASNAAEADLMSDEQCKALLAWIDEHHADPRPKFIVSPSILLPRRVETSAADSLPHEAARNPAATLHSDAWDGYPATFHRVLEKIAERRPKALVFLSGDEHRSCLARVSLRKNGSSDAVAFQSIHSSALYAPFPFANDLQQSLAAKEQFQFAGPRSGSRYECSVDTTFAPEGDGFAVIECTCDAQDRWILRVSYSRNEGLVGDDIVSLYEEVLSPLPA